MPVGALTGTGGTYMNIAIAQSGGPTCAINASLIGAFKQGLLSERTDAIFGSINGIEGMRIGSVYLDKMWVTAVGEPNEIGILVKE